MSCPERWLDVFITKSDQDQSSGEAYNLDEEFCCSVQSVRFAPDYPETAFITEGQSNWILPTWTREYEKAGSRSEPVLSMKAGDLIRIGGVETEGFTDYLTVLEVRHITTLANGTDENVSISKDTDALLIAPDTSTIVDGETLSETLKTDFSKALENTLATTVSSDGIAHIAIRVNATFNCTGIPPKYPKATKADYLYAGVDPSDIGLKDRHKAKTEANGDAGYFYPMYKSTHWANNGRTLRATLNQNVKQVKAVKLCGYSLVNKRQPNIQSMHEIQVDDYIILKINEIAGNVVSNNGFAQGSFAILPAGSHADNSTGAAEVHRYEADGLHCQTISTPHSIQTLTLEVMDRLGRPAHFGRFHLWFKLLVVE
jgi:hypothetical protein